MVIILLNLLFKSIEKQYPKGYVYLGVHCRTIIYNSQDMEATSVSIDRGVDKGDVVHICNEILLSHYKSREHFFVHGRHIYEIRSAKK